MLCFLCGKQIGLLRAIVDQQYCCLQHRKEARLASAKVMREEEGDQELWSVSRQRQHARAMASSSPTSVVTFLALGVLLIAMLMLPGTGSAPGTAFSAASTSSESNNGLISRASDSIAQVIRRSAPVTLHHDFSAGLQDWTTVALDGSRMKSSRDWRLPSASSVVPSGSIRIWTPSVSLANYQMEFQGQIEKRSLSWAFRASDPKNFYAAKIQITRSGPLPNAGLVHYAMLNGHEVDRVQLPLPITLERGADYRVRVSVQDNRFVTYLNGQVISSWTDRRLSHGGIGFFAEAEDQQRIAWVNVSERDSFLGKMLAHFGLFVVPGTSFQ